MGFDSSDISRMSQGKLKVFKHTVKLYDLFASACQCPPVSLIYERIKRPLYLAFMDGISARVTHKVISDRQENFHKNKELQFVRYHTKLQNLHYKTLYVFCICIMYIINCTKTLCCISFESVSVWQYTKKLQM